MSAGEQLSKITPHLERALQDEYVQEQISDALRSLRRSSHRASGKSLTAAARDRGVRRHLQEAANSLGDAVRAVTAPPPKRHHFRRLALLAVLAGAVVFARQRLASGRGGTNG